MGRIIALLYGLIAYVAFAATIIYSIGFVTGLVVPKTIELWSCGTTNAGHHHQLAIDVAVRSPAQRHGATAVQEMVDAHCAGGS